MSRPDPTLPSNSASLPQSEPSLIALVKEQQDSDALKVLVNQHTGIYVNVVSRYAQSYPNVIKQPDLVDDRFFNLYRFIVDYNPERGTKLSTYIGDRTDWMCKEMLKKGRENPIAAGTYGPGGAVPLTIGGDTYATPSGTEVTLVDESASSSVIEMADRDLKTEEVMRVAREVSKDDRFMSILHYRHFNDEGPTSLSWREIGKKVGLSHEGCRKAYFTNIAAVRRRLNRNPALVHAHV